MHGIVLFQLKLFITQNYSDKVWHNIIEGSKSSEHFFSPSTIYDDELAISIIESTCEELSISKADALKAFGEFIAVPLTEIYHPLIKKEWDAIDLIDNTEEVIHKVVRMKMQGAEPPQLITKRNNKNEILISYSSDRQMCNLLKGIAIGMGKHFNQNIEVNEESCMLDGALSCEIIVSSKGERKEEDEDEDELTDKKTTTTEIRGQGNIKSDVQKKRVWYKFWKSKTT